VQNLEKKTYIRTIYLFFLSGNSDDKPLLITVELYMYHLGILTANLSCEYT